MSGHEQGPAATMADFEIVGGEPRSTSGSSRRFLAGFVVAALGAAGVGAGVWAWQAWADQGAQPAEALPGDTLAYVALDLDPSGQQKIAAFNTLRKFPSLKRQLGVDSADDLSKSVVEDIATDSDCELNFGRDVKPWIGDRGAFAVVPQKRPEPVLVVQVKDAAEARTGLKRVSDGCSQHHFGFAVDGDWAVLAKSADVATRVATDADRATLAVDKEFRALTAAAGEPGLATLYAAPEAGPALLDAIERDPYATLTTTEMLNSAFDPVSAIVTTMGMLVIEPDFEEASVPSATTMPDVSPKLEKEQARLEKRFEHWDELSKTEQKRLIREQDKLSEQMYGNQVDDEQAWSEEDFADDGPTPEVPAALRDSLQDFSGLGGVARFAGGGLEVEVVSDTVDGLFGDLYDGSAGGDLVSALPDDTAIAFGGGFSDGWVDSLITRLNEGYQFSGQTEEKTIAAFEKSTGLDLPGDLEDLGGDGISMVVGAGFSPDVMFEHPEKAKVAVRITGDADRIEAALDKLRGGLRDHGASSFLSRRAGDDVVVGPDAAYLDELADGADSLGDSDRFHKVVPEAKDATTVFFIDFDAGDWLAKMAESDGARKDAEPLDAFGMTVTKHGDQQRILLRMSFD